MAIERIKGDEDKGELARLMRTKGKHSDGGGLYLQVAKEGQASWVFRYKDRQTQKDRWPCVGPASVYKIDEAREKAREARKAVLEGRDPFAVLSAGRARPAGKSFATAMAEYLAAKSPHWADSNRARELRRYGYLFGQIPDFVALPVTAIDQAAKNKALATWDGQTKARRDVGFYIEAIIRYAETGKLRVATVSDDQGHHEAMPWREVPSFYACIAEVRQAASDAALDRRHGLDTSRCFVFGHLLVQFLDLLEHLRREPVAVVCGLYLGHNVLPSNVDPRDHSLGVVSQRSAEAPQCSFGLSDRVV